MKNARIHDPRPSGVAAFSRCVAHLHNTRRHRLGYPGIWLFAAAPLCPDTASGRCIDTELTPQSAHVLLGATQSTFVMASAYPRG